MSSTASQPMPSPPAPRKSAVPWIVGAVVLFLVLVIGGLVFALSGGRPGSVQEVADQAVEAAEDLDVDAGVALLCDAPTAEQRDELEDYLERARDMAGTEDPEVTYAVSGVEGDEEGSFVVEVTSEEDGLKDSRLKFRVVVETDGEGHSCVDRAEDLR